jgi:hypothetical protein
MDLKTDVFSGQVCLFLSGGIYAVKGPRLLQKQEPCRRHPACGSAHLLRSRSTRQEWCASCSHLKGISVHPDEFRSAAVSYLPPRHPTKRKIASAVALPRVLAKYRLGRLPDSHKKTLILAAGSPKHQKHLPRGLKCIRNDKKPAPWSLVALCGS